MFHNHFRYSISTVSFINSIIFRYIFVAEDSIAIQLIRLSRKLKREMVFGCFASLELCAAAAAWFCCCCSSTSVHRGWRMLIHSMFQNALLSWSWVDYGCWVSMTKHFSRKLTLMMGWRWLDCDSRQHVSVCSSRSALACFASVDDVPQVCRTLLSDFEFVALALQSSRKLSYIWTSEMGIIVKSVSLDALDVNFIFTYSLDNLNRFACWDLWNLSILSGFDNIWVMLWPKKAFILSGSCEVQEIDKRSKTEKNLPSRFPRTWCPSCTKDTLFHHLVKKIKV